MNRAQVLLRAYQPSDAAQVDAINRAAQAATGHPNPEFYPASALATALNDRPALRRFVATIGADIVGHMLIEPANPEHVPAWRAALGSGYARASLIEIGGAFVDPAHFNQGIFTQLLAHSVSVIRSDFAAIPVCATWSDNAGVIHRLSAMSAISAGHALVRGGRVELFALKPTA